MKERITFFHPQDTGVPPEELKIHDGGLEAPSLQTTREDRLTVTLDELPSEVATVLADYASLRVSWTSPLAYQTVEPLVSRLSPGLHVLFTPVTKESPNPSKLCGLLGAFDSSECVADEVISTTVKNEGGQFTIFRSQENLDHFIQWIGSKICAAEDSHCQERARGLQSASSVDLTYDAATKTAKLTAFWPLQEQSVSISASDSRRTEVGILTRGSPPNIGPHDLGASGLLAVPRERKHPSPALFSFQARHRSSNGHFSSKFLTPTGLHPTLQLSLSDSNPPVEDELAECKPFAYFTLPKTIFADRFQLDGDLFMASKNLTTLRSTTLPVDLEAPAYTTRPWGSNILLELAPPPPREAQSSWTVEVPLHLRYLEPSATGERTIEVPYPAVFWACSADQSERFAQNPFDRAGLGYDTLFEPDTVFWHVEPRPEAGDRLLNSVTVPVLNSQGSDLVALGTTVVVALGFGWVLWKLYGAYAKTGYQASGKASEKDLKEKKKL